MTYFPVPAWALIKEFLLPPPLPEGRHPTAKILQDALPLWMLSVQHYDSPDRGDGIRTTWAYNNAQRANAMLSVFKSNHTYGIPHQDFYHYPFYQKGDESTLPPQIRDRYFQMLRPQSPRKVGCRFSFFISSNTTRIKKHLKLNGITFTSKMKRKELLQRLMSY